MKKRYYLKGLPSKKLTTKKRKELIRFSLYLLFFFLIASLAFYIIFGPYFQVKDVQIQGVFRFDSKENLEKEIDDLITQRILFLKTKNIFLIHQKSLEKKLKERDFLIRELRLEKEYPSRIFIVLTERSPLGVLESRSGSFFFDETGLVFLKTDGVFLSDKQQRNLLKVRDLSREAKLGCLYFSKGEIHNFGLIKNFFEAKLDNPLKEIDVSNFNKVIVETEEGWKVFFDFEENLDINLQKLDILLANEIPREKRKKLDYIDLRFEKIFYKYKEE